MSFALHAGVRVDYINVPTSTHRFGGALWSTGVTINTIFGNRVRHYVPFVRILWNDSKSELKRRHHRLARLSVRVEASEQQLYQCDTVILQGGNELYLFQFEKN